MIAATDLTVTFGRTVALDSVSVGFGEGITGLFGQNGSGKSTLLRVVAGLLRPTSGTVVVLGLPASARDESLTRRVGYVGHDSGLYPELTVAENLTLWARLYEVPEERARERLEEFGIRGHERTPAGNLSAGLRRRVAVARALLHDPDVLLLDEPYANLDDDASALLSEALTTWRRPGRAGIVATHGAKKVKAYADAGVILQRGRVQVAGSYRSAENVTAP